VRPNIFSGADGLRKILLIEDDPLFRKSMTVFMRSMGYEVLATDSGESGLKVLEQEGFDLMIADYQLPGITGIEVVRAMRERGIQIPVVLMSANLNAEAEREARAERVNVVFKKSIRDLQLLRPTLTELLERPT
jgi:CheY-like chemotaxis protein